MRRLYNIAALLCAGLAAVLTSASPAAANGYWNLPSSCCQCWGVGFGAGYHANLVLGPMTCREALNHKEVRLAHAPSPPCGYQYGYDYHPYRSQLGGAVAAPTVAHPADASHGMGVTPMPVTNTPAETLPHPTEFAPEHIELPSAPIEAPIPADDVPPPRPIFGAPYEPGAP